MTIRYTIKSSVFAAVAIITAITDMATTTAITGTATTTAIMDMAHTDMAHLDTDRMDASDATGLESFISSAHEVSIHGTDSGISMDLKDQVMMALEDKVVTALEDQVVTVLVDQAVTGQEDQVLTNPVSLEGVVLAVIAVNAEGREGIMEKGRTLRSKRFCFEEL